MAYDLPSWHRALHQVTGAMALRWCHVGPSDLRAWAHELRAIAAALDQAAAMEPASEPAAAKAEQPAAIPEWLLNETDYEAPSSPKAVDMQGLSGPCCGHVARPAGRRMASERLTNMVNAGARKAVERASRRREAARRGNATSGHG
jgi:hypothetical protein